ncbi:MAG: type II toxin-antitoxin system PemK/MazF family toxin [Ignavibacteria bacterium]
MEKSVAGDIIAINYPFSDLTSFKARPALIISKANKTEFIICQITSKDYEEPDAIKIEEQDLFEGTLHKTSYALTSKLFTSDSKLFKYKIGTLNKIKFHKVVSTIINILNKNLSQ